MSPNKQTQNSYAQIEELFPDIKYVTPKKTSVWSAIFKLLASLIFITGVIVGSVSLLTLTATNWAYNIWESLPLKVTIGDTMYKTNIYATDNAGTPVLLASFYDENREPIAEKDLPQIVKDATISAEDKNFYKHEGVDFTALLRAGVANYLNEGIQQGGSSIHQQYIKNVLLQEALMMNDDYASKDAINAATEQTLKRKISEARMALYLNKNYTKDEILAGYINIVHFGGTVYGIKAASKYYFNVEPKGLTLSQAATLMAIINKPEAYRLDKPDNPKNGSENGYAYTKERRDYILKRMLEDEKITEKEYTEAVASPIEPVITPSLTGCEPAGGAAFFCDYVVRVVLNDPAFGETPEEREKMLKRGGLNIYTTLNLDVQAAAEAGINLLPKTSPALEIGGSVVSVETKTGRIIAMAQNKNYSNNAELAEKDHSYTSINYNADLKYGGSSGFQTGSTFKLFTLIEWFNQGHKVYEQMNNYGRVTQIKNSCTPEGYWNGDYRYSNADGSTASWTNIYYGTAQSLNTTYVGMAEKLDLCNISKTAESLGAVRADGKDMFVDPAMVIGTNEIAPLSMASAYGTVANGGTYCKPVAIDKIVLPTGEEMKPPAQSCEQKVNPEVAAAVNFIMKDIASWGWASGGNPRTGTPMIAKTGTTDDVVDSWVIMSTTNVATAVWIGNTIGKVSLLNMNEANPENLKYDVMRTTMASANSIYGGDEFTPPRRDYLY